MRKLDYLFACTLLLLACGDDDEDPAIDGAVPGVDSDLLPVDGGAADAGADAAAPAEFELTSTAVEPGELLADTYVCTMHSGDNISPPLAWTPGPEGTLSYAIIFRDLSFDGFLHSAIWDIPTGTLSLPEDVSKVHEPEEVPGAKQSKGYNGQFGYQGPCPPDVHTYEFTIYALDVASLPGLDQRSELEDVVAAVEAHDLAAATLELQSD
jgi:Raf kinase inhibitor-like YbhB/YbcL family protein